MIAYFCHPDDFAVFPGGIFLLLVFFAFGIFCFWYFLLLGFLAFRFFSFWGVGL